MAEPRVTILHVDDNEANRYIVTRILKNVGFTVVEAATGAAGLSAVTEHQPDLVILDVKLPDLNGFEVCRQIKSNPETTFIPVLHLSASFVKSQDKAEGLDSGADAYLAQPVEPIELIATVRSLLRIRQAEESAMSLAREWQTTFDSINDGVGLLDRDGRFLRCNLALTKIFNRPLGEILGCLPQELLTSVLDLGDGLCFDEAKATGQRKVVEMHGKGRWFSKTIDPVLDAQGSFTGAVFILSDITERKRAETSLRFLADASSVLANSLDYKTILLNIARLAVPDLADFCFFDIVTAEETIERVAWHHADLGKQAEFERVRSLAPSLSFQKHPVVGVLLSGQSLFVPEVSDAWLQAIATNVEHLQFMRELNFCSLISVPLVANDRMMGVLTVCLLADSGRHYTIADLVLAEELARRTALALANARLYYETQEANRIKDEFLAVLSHELRSPLNPILGWAKILQTSKQDEARTKFALETIERNAKLQAQLIEDLLDVSRILQGKLNLKVSPVGLTFTIKAALETVRLAAEAKSIQIETIFEPNVGQVLGDSSRLQQVVWNLLSNAIKFTPHGGRVEVHLKQVTADSRDALNPRALSPSSHAAYAQISVRDTGRGISAKFLPYVFEYFRQADSTTTRKFGGLGLGLAIVRHLTEAHGGTVQAFSPGEEQGATFTVRLPIIPASPNLHQDDPAAGKYPDFNLTGLQVLLVDDDRDTREFIVFLLEQYGAIVTEAASAQEATDLLKQGQPNLLISDIGMPEMDGYMLIRQIRAQSFAGQQIPAIALTAYASETDHQQALAAGFQQHITKPIDPEVLIQTIMTLLKRET